MNLSRPIPAVPVLVTALALAAALGGCTGGGLNRITDDGGGGSAAGAPSGMASQHHRGSDEVISLTKEDLAPMDAFVHAQNSQWIVGDEIEIVASREYFAGMLTLNAPWTGEVVKKTEVVGDEEITTMTYRGAKGRAGVMVNPRANIHTGITATARRTLRLRMVKTRDAEMPVRLLIVARGEASRGVREKVVARGPALQIGGALRRRGGGYAWESFGTSR